jgi:hypothetical protein
MTRAEARRLSGRENDERGPDPTEDPIVYLEEARKEPEKKEK